MVIIDFDNPFHLINQHAAHKINDKVAEVDF